MSINENDLIIRKILEKCDYFSMVKEVKQITDKLREPILQTNDPKYWRDKSKEYRNFANLLTPLANIETSINSMSREELEWMAEFQAQNPLQYREVLYTFIKTSNGEN